LVSPGTYVESIDFKGKMVFVVSLGGAGMSIQRRTTEVSCSLAWHWFRSTREHEADQIDQVGNVWHR